MEKKGGGLLAKVNTDGHKYYCKTLITGDWVIEPVSILSARLPVRGMKMLC
jgi:hypothetical protein